MRRHGQWLVRWSGALCMLAACGRGAPREQRPAEAATRHMLAVSWDTLFQIGGVNDDTILQLPTRPVADTQGVTLFDLYAGSVLRFDRRGNLLWRWGRKGRGPGELSHPRDLKRDGVGRTWVLDLEAQRITVLDPAGRLAFAIPLDRVGGDADDFAPIAGDRAILVTKDPQRPLVTVSSDGKVLERRPFPWPLYARLNPLASQVITGSDPGSGRWVAALQVADGFFGFQWDRYLFRGWYAEPIPLPEVTVERHGGLGRTETTSRLSQPVFAAASVALSASRIYVLFDGRGSNASRVVDSFSAATGAYIESYLLPRKVEEIAFAGGTFYVLFQSPYPALAAWRPSGLPLP